MQYDFQFEFFFFKSWVVYPIVLRTKHSSNIMYALLIISVNANETEAFKQDGERF